MKKNRYPILAAAIFSALLGAGLFPGRTTAASGQNRSAAVSEQAAAPDDEETKQRFTFISPFANNGYWGNAARGVMEADETYGCSTKCVSFAEYTKEQYAGAILSAVYSDVDGIIAWGDESSEVEEAFSEASEAGIPVVLIDNDSAAIDRLCYIGTDNYGAGRLAGQDLCDGVTATAGQDGAEKVVAEETAGQAGTEKAVADETAGQAGAEEAAAEETAGQAGAEEAAAEETADQAGAEEAAAEETADQAGAEEAAVALHIAVIIASRDVQNQAQRLQGFEDEVALHENASVDAVLEANYSVISLKEMLPELLSQNPRINAIFCAEGYSSKITGEILDNLGISHEDMKVVAFDSTQATLGYIASGRYYSTILQEPQQMASMAVDMLYDYAVNGVTPEADTVYTGTHSVKAADLDSVTADENEGVLWHLYNRNIQQIQ